MEKKWFLAIDGKQVGPVADLAIENLLKNGRINGETLVWKHGMETWAKLVTVDALKKFIPRLTPPPLPPEVFQSSFANKLTLSRPQSIATSSTSSPTSVALQNEKLVNDKLVPLTSNQYAMDALKSYPEKGIMLSLYKLLKITPSTTIKNIKIKLIGSGLCILAWYIYLFTNFDSEEFLAISTGLSALLIYYYAREKPEMPDGEEGLLSLPATLHAGFQIQFSLDPNDIITNDINTGTLTTSKTMLVFQYGDCNDDQLNIPYSNIASMKKCKTLGIMQNKIILTMKDKKKYTFCSPFFMPKNKHYEKGKMIIQLISDAIQTGVVENAERIM